MSTPIGTDHAALDARTVAAATGGTVVRAAQQVARGITTDSRAVVRGGAFVALAGERYDGHDFVASAIEAGASLVVVQTGRAPADTRADVVEVPDTLTAWGDIARHHLQAWREAVPGRRVVGITGSAGKTTTKELCAALLGAVAPCHATAGNLNNRIGLPAVVLQLEPVHRYAVLEMGMSLPGEIAALASVATPDVGVIVNVGLAHAGGVGGTLEDVLREKGALFEGVRPGGHLVANGDDPSVVARAARRSDAIRVSFGRASTADVRLVSREAAGAAGIPRRGRARGACLALHRPHPRRGGVPGLRGRPGRRRGRRRPHRRCARDPRAVVPAPHLRAHAGAARPRLRRDRRRVQRQPREHARGPGRPVRDARLAPRGRAGRDEGAGTGRAARARGARRCRRPGGREAAHLVRRPGRRHRPCRGDEGGRGRLLGRCQRPRRARPVELVRPGDVVLVKASRSRRAPSSSSRSSRRGDVSHGGA